MIILSLLSLSLAVSGAPQYGSSRSPAQVRVLNAAADCGPLWIQVGDVHWPSTPYGQRSEYTNVRGQKVGTHLANISGERLTNDVQVSIQPGYPHTIVFTGFVMKEGKFDAIVLRDVKAGRPVISQSQMTFVNAMSDGITISIRMDGKKLMNADTLKYGKSSSQLGFSPKEYTAEILDEQGAQLYTTKFAAQGATRYTVVAMGSLRGKDNRGPRLFYYAF